VAVVVGLALAVVQLVAGLFSFAGRRDTSFEEWQERRMHYRAIVGLLCAFVGICVFTELIVVLLCVEFWLFGKADGTALLGVETYLQALLLFVLFMPIYRNDNYSWRLSFLLGGFCCSVLAFGAVVSKGVRPPLLAIFVQQVDTLRLPAVGVLMFVSVIHLGRLMVKLGNSS
jgi:hypothetical protein